MKGIVFVELLSMAESVAGEGAVDEVLDSLSLESDGAYSSVGKYPCAELFQIVDAFSARLGQSQSDLKRAFGKWMHGRFLALYPEFFQDKSTAFDMLEGIENEVHVEVLKLYPDAELPSFETQREGNARLTMIYRSERPLGCFCMGLIEACLEHFGEKATIKVDDHSTQGGSHISFLIERQRD